LNKITNLFKKIFEIQEGLCVSDRIVCIDDILGRLTVRKEIIFNDRLIIIDEYVDYPQSHYTDDHHCVA